MRELWMETKRCVLLKGRPESDGDLARRAFAKMGTEPSEDALRKALAECAEEVRPGADDVVVVLKHIGSEDNKTVWDTMEAEWKTSVSKMQHTSRKALIELHGTPEAAITFYREQHASSGGEWVKFKHVIQDHMETTQEWIATWEKRRKDLILAGVVDGEEAYRTLYRVGGNDMLSIAAGSVVEFQKMDPRLGED